MVQANNDDDNDNKTGPYRRDLMERCSCLQQTPARYGLLVLPLQSANDKQLDYNCKYLIVNECRVHNATEIIAMTRTCKKIVQDNSLNACHAFLHKFFQYICFLHRTESCTSIPCKNRFLTHT